ncbi:hypothetical protein [Rubrimonas cliftonensis]|uniref:Septal ring factor EnvC, activator of murein hydrolases AmiA and AmiB n=1 Tax=Rubrimonas cliftonensis TaxID=89524 RepID=A0A1H4B4I7_9RHOB|nr:hypothetical protein [Rubrimonas cliftonensis]SEA43051.1 hypothetical protein SAMN05444370_10519 [Rubrimonas cliftonensis]
MSERGADRALALRAAATLALTAWLTAVPWLAQAQEDAALARLAEARAALRAAERARAVAAEDLRPEQARAFATLAALDRIGRAPPLALLTHPGGPAQAARAAMTLAAAAPALAARGAAIRAGIARLNGAREAAAASAARLAVSAQAARAPATAAPPQSGPAPTPRPEAVAGPADPQETADAVRRLLGALAAMDAPLETVGGTPPPEPWRAPVAGPARPGPGTGATVLAAPHAGVRAPMVASVRYAGPDGGPGPALTVVLEPAAGVLVALRGLGAISVAAGDTVAAGALLGAMAGPPPDADPSADPAADEFLIDASASNGTIQPEALYIEVTRAGAATDPADWFRFTDERTTR